MKIVKILMMLLLTSAFLVSCSSPESDAKKTVENTCAVFEAKDEKTQEEILEKNKAHAEEMLEKYGSLIDTDKGSASEEDKKAYWKALAKEMKESDCIKP